MKLKAGLLFFFFFHMLRICEAQKGNFEISIIQDGNTISPGIMGDIVLNKSPFKILVKLTQLEGVYLFASFKDSIYKTSNNDMIPGFAEITSMVMAENAFNPNQEMIMNDEGWAYWYYDPKDESYRFDKDIFKDGDDVTGTKTIKQFYDYAAGKEIAVKDVKDPLYLFFFSATHDNNHNLKKELKRFKIKINWKN
ncbi:MAG: hypothetical protein QM737_22315 [Ferruginibacter sp.]